MIKELIDNNSISFFNESRKEVALQLINDVKTNLHQAQNYLISKRMQLLFLTGLYILLVLGIIEFNKIPGVEGKVDSKLFIFSSLNSAITCFLPLAFVITHYLMINSLIYRSQMRLILTRGYERYFSEIVSSQLMMYSNPFSPGGNVKGINNFKKDQLQTEQGNKPSSEKKTLVRTIIKNAEIYMTWMVLICMTAYHFFKISSLSLEIANFPIKHEVSKSVLIGELVSYSVVSAAIIVIVFFGTLSMARKYKNNNSWKHFLLNQ